MFQPQVVCVQRAHLICTCVAVAKDATHACEMSIDVLLFSSSVDYVCRRRAELRSFAHARCMHRVGDGRGFAADSAATYTNWGADQPSNECIPGEDCVEVDSEDGTWNDQFCAVHRAFVCALLTYCAWAGPTAP